MPKIDVPFFDDLQRYSGVKPGDLVSVAVYETRDGGIMVASPHWLLKNKNPTQPELHNSKSRTRAVSALVVDSRPARKEAQRLLQVIIEDQKIVVPAACVVEVLNNG